ncbi:nucleotidyltransferase family protein [Sporosarcina obsidiansis]|uniref:nucleotidyltransferase family protein n=1 Tax=Sporosarcina obsidiansis TaxID=2660748 RepID=UPI00129B9AFD|nr:nucleotidyltransferase family protein [Sporosarcina obsidiansis]
MKPSICAIILAAGTSSRMGKPKQLLPLGEQSLLERTIHRLVDEDFSEVIAVIGHEAKAIKEKISIKNERFRWIENEAYLTGQSSSLKTGIVSLKEHHSHAMVFLGDLPFISDETIRLIYQTGVDRLKEYGESFVIRPTYKEVPGHPVFFGNINRHHFAQLQGDTGGKSIMKRIPHHILLEVEDEGILMDVDSPEDYVEAKRRWRGYHE